MTRLQPTTTETSSKNGERPVSVLAINQYYAPDIASSGRLLAELCEGLAERGARVTVVTGQPSYVHAQDPAPVFERLRGVDVHRVSMGRATGRASLLRRLTGYARFMFSAYRKSRAVAENVQPDVVVTMSDPPSVGLIGGDIARRADARFIYILFDLFPDIAVASRSSYARWPVIQLWNRMNRWVFTRSHTIAVPGHAMRSTLADRRGVVDSQVVVMPNWPLAEASESQVEPGDIRAELGIPEGTLLVLTAGNLGTMQRLEPLVEAANKLRGSKTGFLFMGNGVQKDRLQQKAREKNLDNAWFLGFQPEDRFARIVSAADICVVALESEFNGLSMPSRTYTYMSAGKPVLAVMKTDDDVARLLKQHECGWQAYDADEIVHILERLVESPVEIDVAGKNAAQAVEQEYSKQVAIDQYFELITRIAADGKQG